METTNPSFLSAVRVAAAKAIGDREEVGAKVATARKTIGETLTNIRTIASEKFADARSRFNEVIADVSEGLAITRVAVDVYQTFKEKLDQYDGEVPQQVHVTAADVVLHMDSPRGEVTLANNAYDSTYIEDCLNKLLPDCWDVDKDVTGDEVAWVFTHLAS